MLPTRCLIALLIIVGCLSLGQLVNAGPEIACNCDAEGGRANPALDATVLSTTSTSPPSVSLGPTNILLTGNTTFTCPYVTGACLVCQFACVAALPSFGYFNICPRCLARYYNYGCMQSTGCKRYDLSTQDEKAMAIAYCMKGKTNCVCTPEEISAAPELKTMNNTLRKMVGWQYIINNPTLYTADEVKKADNKYYYGSETFFDALASYMNRILMNASIYTIPAERLEKEWQVLLTKPEYQTFLNRVNKTGYVIKLNQTNPDIYTCNDKIGTYAQSSNYCCIEHADPLKRLVCFYTEAAWKQFDNYALGIKDLGADITAIQNKVAAILASGT